MAERRSREWRYRAPIERRRVPDATMGAKPWLPEGEQAPPVKRYTEAEIAAFVAARPDLRATAKR